MKESFVKRAIKDLLTAERIPWFPMQSGKVKSQFGGWVHMCQKGTADLLAIIHADYASTFQYVLWIEAKRPGGRIRPEQLEFADFVRNRGHYWLLVDDVKILQEWLREHRAR